MEKIAHFKIIGISTETTNKSRKAAEDLGKLWQQFFKENVAGRIANKLSDEIYSIYTDYESDFTGNYKAIIGCCLFYYLSYMSVADLFVYQKAKACRLQ